MLEGNNEIGFKKTDNNTDKLNNDEKYLIKKTNKLYLKNDCKITTEVNNVAKSLIEGTNEVYYEKNTDINTKEANNEINNVNNQKSIENNPLNSATNTNDVSSNINNKDTTEICLQINNELSKDINSVNVENKMTNGNMIMVPMVILNNESFAIVITQCPNSVLMNNNVSNMEKDDHKKGKLKKLRNAPMMTCPICNKTLSRKSTLKTHLSLHEDIKPFSCNVCFKSFTKQSALSRHLLIHQSKHSFACDVCHNTFSRKSDLYKHSFFHSKVKASICRICNKGYTHPMQLQKHHQLDHTREPLCILNGDEPTSEKSNEKGDGSKPIHLDACENRDSEKHDNGSFEYFSSQINCLNHLSINQNVFNAAPNCYNKSHTCEHCSQSFDDDTMLQNHLLTHVKSSDKSLDNSVYVIQTDCDNTFVNDHSINLSFIVSESVISIKSVLSSNQELESKLENLQKGVKGANDLVFNKDTNLPEISSHTDVISLESSKLCDVNCIILENAKEVVSDSVVNQNVNVPEISSCSKVFALEISKSSDVKYAILENTEKVTCNSVTNKDIKNINFPEISCSEILALQVSNSNLKSTEKVICSSGNILESIIESNPSNKCVNSSPADLSSSKIKLDNVVKAVESHICDICHKTYASKSSLKTHISLHTNMKPYTCEICYASFAKKCTLTLHSLIHSGERPHACSTCGKQFTRKHDLQKHNLIHTGEKPYVCDFCNARFNHQNNLKRHKRIHTGEKLYACNICFKSFAATSSLLTHSKQHIKEAELTNNVNEQLKLIKAKLHMCDICNTGFARKDRLLRHKITHNAKEMHNCSVCNHTFKSKEQLQLHSLIHVDVSLDDIPGSDNILDDLDLTKLEPTVQNINKTFSCDLCVKVFSSKRALGVHQMIHTGERPYVCKICQKSFAQNITLKRHRVVHTGERPYTCNMCKKSFTRKTSLRKHIIFHS